MISIIIPIYNQARKLLTTLNSIGNQTLTDWEVIVVDDGSSDNPRQVFKDFQSSYKGQQRLIYVNQENQGAPAARNRGFKDSNGDFIFFCDADANLKPEALTSLLGALTAQPQAAYAYSSFYWGKKLFKVGQFDADKLRKMPYIHTMSLIRRSDFPETMWDETIKKFQDWDLWLSIYKLGKEGIFVDQILFSISPGGTISSWLPGIAYRLCPYLKAVKKYKQAMKIIKEKHGLL